MTTIVFSKDRAMQLHAFLRSYRDHVTPLAKIDVLYQASTGLHKKAYDEVFEDYPRGGVPFAWKLLQGNFKDDVLFLLPLTEGSVVFFVDDQIFIRPWTVDETPGLSLRLAPHLTRDYPTNSDQSLPAFVSVPDERLSWLWSQGEKGWNYSLSLDGHVYDLAEMREMVASIDFNSPNTLESALQVYAPKFRQRQGTCYHHSKVVNVPWNRVQTDNSNRFAHGPTAEQMLDAWEAGLQIDIKRFYGITNAAVHQEFDCVLEPRT